MTVTEVVSPVWQSGPTAGGWSASQPPVPWRCWPVGQVGVSQDSPSLVGRCPAGQGSQPDRSALGTRSEPQADQSPQSASLETVFVEPPTEQTCSAEPSSGVGDVVWPW